MGLYWICPVHSIALYSGYLVGATPLSFPWKVLKLCRCFLHGMKICMWFGYNPLISFSHHFCFENLVSFFCYEILSECIDSEYLVGSTPHSFPTIIFKFCRCFLHGMKMCMWFWFLICFPMKYRDFSVKIQFLFSLFVKNGFLAHLSQRLIW